MTDILRDPSFDPAAKELHVAWSGDKDFGDHEARRLGKIEDFKLDRLGAALFPEGFVADGLPPSVAPVMNLVFPANDFTAWTAVNGATVVPAYAPDRDGVVGKASRLVGAPGQDSYIELDLASIADGRKVFALDLAPDTTAAIQLAIFDGVAEKTANLAPAAGWSRVYIAVDDDFDPGASELKLRIRPAVPPLAASAVIARAQLEDVPAGLPLEPGVYVETTTAPATAPGHRVVIPAATIYVGGLPRPLPAAELAFDPEKVTGVDTIYAEFAERYVLGIVDNGLDNPVTGRPGNDSVREETAWRTTDTTDPAVAADPVVTNPQYRARVAAAVFQFDRATNVVTLAAPTSRIEVDKTIGSLHGTRIAPKSIPEDRLDSGATENQPGLVAAASRRTRNIAGGFVVPHFGDTPKIEQDTTDVSQVVMRIDPLDGYTPDGRAHYLDRPAIVTTALQASTANRKNESQTFYAGTDTYRFGKVPVESVNELAGYYRVTEPVTRGAVPGGADELGNGPVFQILSVTQGATTYDGSPGGDYTQIGDSIDWGGPGAEPAAGTTYTVTYLYLRVWPAGEFTFTDDELTFTGANRPEDTYPFILDYQYGQDRVDLVALTPDGLQVLAGTPSDHPTPPPVPRGWMALWDVVVGYDALSVQFRPRFVVGVPMAKLSGLFEAVDQLRYNVAQLAASVSLRDRLGTLKDTVTDPFLDGSLLDAGAAWYGTSGNAVARVDAGRLKQARTSTEALLAVTTAETTMLRKGAWLGLPYTAATPAEAKQTDFQTGQVSVNPFGSYDPIPPLISVSIQGWKRCGHAHHGTFRVTGVNFAPNEAGIVIRFGGSVVATVTADATGSFSYTTGSIVVGPTTIVSATAASGAPSVAMNAAIGWPRNDPAGQSFALVEDGDLVGFVLYFTGKDTTKPVIVSLRTMLAGLPTEDIVPGTLRVLQPAQVNVGGVPTVIEFERPIPIEGDVGYAAVAASDSSAYMLALAQLGKTNTAPGGGIVTRNPYTRGTLLLSGDGRSWTPVQDMDLRFAAQVAHYDTMGPKVAMFDTLTFPAGVTSFELIAFQTLGAGASLRWEYSTNPAAATPAWTPFDPGDAEVPNLIPLGELVTELRVRAIASTARALGGVAIQADNLLLTAHLPATLSSYVQPQRALLDPTTSAKAFTKVALRSGTSVPAFATNDDGATWEAGTLVNTRQLTDELAEQEWSFTFGAAGSEFRGRLDLLGTTTSEPEVEEASFVIQ